MKEGIYLFIYLSMRMTDKKNILIQLKCPISVCLNFVFVFVFIQQLSIQSSANEYIES